jgi:DNA-binding transcriptional LysR family regulator
MDLRELGYFVAVYEEQSVTAAARRCFISQPSVSAALSSLEHELETKLFVRHRKGATPTTAAEQLYPKARKLVDEAQALKATFRTKVRATRLTVGLMQALDVERTREVLTVMTSQPGVQLRVVGADDPCDVRLVGKTGVHKDELFVPLWSERFVVALPSTHPLAREIGGAKTSAQGERLVERCHCDHARHFPRGKKRVDAVAVAQSEEWAVALVSAGVGIAIIPEGCVRPDPRVVVRALADVHVTRDVGLAYRPRSAHAEDVHALVEKVRRRF